MTEISITPDNNVLPNFQKTQKQSQPSESTEITPKLMTQLAKKNEGVKVESSKLQHPITTTNNVDTIKKTAIEKVKKHEKPTTTPQITKSGIRIYHTKKELLPWFENMFTSGNRSCDYIVDKFTQLIRARTDLNDSQKNELISIATIEVASIKKNLQTEKEEIFQSSKLEENLNTVLLPEKKIVEAYKDISKSIEKSVQKYILACAKNIQTTCMPDLPKEATRAIIKFSDEISSNSQNIEGFCRYALIHEDPLWNPEKVTNPSMIFDSKKSKDILVTSSFQPCGPGYSSAAPRNRKVDNAFVPNFFRTTQEIKPEGSETSTVVLNVTRSAITVEFDQPNLEERKKTNQKLVQQVVDVQVNHFIENTDPEKLKNASDPSTPITFKGQTVNLLTPDILRSLAREYPFLKQIGVKIYDKITGAPADDERALALENLQAHQALNGKVVPHSIKDENGNDTTIYVKYDLRYFNIPNNILNATLPSVLTDNPALTKSNNDNWDKLETDVKKQIQNLEAMIKNFKPTSPDEEKKLDSILARIHSNISLRAKIMDSTITTKNKSETEFKRWQQEADMLATEFRTLETDTNLSEEFQKALQVAKKYNQLNDVFIDTKELFKSGLSKNLTNMDNNRSALATRIILLGALTDEIEVHFGCRSGKDRTGIVDIELKLLLTESNLEGRTPSYREEERLTDITNHRETMTMHSGNVFEIIKGNLGASTGINTEGSTSDPLEENEAGVQYKQFTDAAQAFAKMVTRPATSWNIPSAHEEYWKTNTGLKFTDAGSLIAGFAKALENKDSQEFVRDRLLDKVNAFFEDHNNPLIKKLELLAALPTLFDAKSTRSLMLNGQDRLKKLQENAVLLDRELCSGTKLESTITPLKQKITTEYLFTPEQISGFSQSDQELAQLSNKWVQEFPDFHMSLKTFGRIGDNISIDDTPISKMNIYQKMQPNTKSVFAAGQSKKSEMINTILIAETLKQNLIEKHNVSQDTAVKMVVSLLQGGSIDATSLPSHYNTACTFNMTSEGPEIPLKSYLKSNMSFSWNENTRTCEYHYSQTMQRKSMNTNQDVSNINLNYSVYAPEERASPIIAQLSMK